MTISYDDFLKVDIRVGTIVSAREGEGLKKPAYWMKIDFGSEIGVKKSSAQITALYKVDDLIGKQVMAVINFEPRQIGKFMSEVLTLGFADGNGDITLSQPDRLVPNGERMY